MDATPPADSNPVDPAPTVPDSSRGWIARGLCPPLGTWIGISLCAAAIVAGRLVIERVDRAAANILTLILSFVIVVWLLVWLSWRSSYPAMVRRLVPLSLLGIVVLAIATLRIDETTATLIPKLRWAWTPKADQRLNKVSITKSANAIDLSTTGPDDFPGFLGPRRDGVITGRGLASDWSSASPRLIWKQEIGAGWSAFSVVHGYAVTMEQRGTEELVTCYEARTGKLVWSHAESTRHETVLGGVGPRSTPTIDGGRVYTLGATGRLLCLDGADGSLIWRQDLLADREVEPKQDEARVAWGRSNSPLIVDDLVVVPLGGRPPGTNGPNDKGNVVSLVAFRKASGERVWEAGTDQISFSSPLLAEIGGEPQIVVVNESTVTGHDPATGKVLWTESWPGSSSSSANTSQAVSLPGDQILISKAYGGGAKLIHLSKVTEGEWKADVVWANSRVLKTKFTNVVIDGDQAYGLSDGILECIDWPTGKTRWKKGRYEHGQILRVDNRLLILSESGELAFVEVTPEKWHELAKFPALDGKTWNNLCLAGRLLLIRNGQEAACYELP